MRILGRKSNLKLLYRRPGALLARHWCVLLVLVIGASWDAWTTIQFVGRHGPEEEVHPVAMIFFKLALYVLHSPALVVAVGKLVQVVFVILVAAIFRGWTGILMVSCGLLYLLAGFVNHFGWMVAIYRLFPGLLYN
jgi:hypothetical protein